MPILDVHNIIFWKAWKALNVRRFINQHGAQPIQISEILAYADLVNIKDLNDREDLIYHIGQLDDTFLTFEYERTARERKKAAQRRGRRAKRG